MLTPSASSAASTSGLGFGEILSMTEVSQAAEVLRSRLALLNLGNSSQSQQLRSSLYDTHIMALLDRIFGEMEAGASGPTAVWMDAASCGRMPEFIAALEKGQDAVKKLGLSNEEVRAIQAALSLDAILDITDKTGAPAAARPLMMSSFSSSSSPAGGGSHRGSGDGAEINASMFVDVNPSGLTFQLRRDLLPPSTKSLLDATAGTSPPAAFLPFSSASFNGWQKELFLRTDPLLWILQRNSDKVSGPSTPMLPPMSTKLANQAAAAAAAASTTAAAGAGAGGAKKKQQQLAQPQYPNSWPDGIYIALNDLLLCYFVHFASSHTRRTFEKPAHYHHVGGPLHYHHHQQFTSLLTHLPHLAAHLHHHDAVNYASKSPAELYASVDERTGLPLNGGACDALAHQTITAFSYDNSYLDLLFRYVDTILGSSKALDHAFAPVFLAAIQAYWLLHNPPSTIPLPGEEQPAQLLPNPLGVFVGFPSEAALVARTIQQQQQQLVLAASGSASSSSAGAGASPSSSSSASSLAFSASLVAPLSSSLSGVGPVADLRCRYGPAGVPAAETEHLFGAAASAGVSSLSATLASSTAAAAATGSSAGASSAAATMSSAGSFSNKSVTSLLGSLKTPGTTTTSSTAAASAGSGSGSGLGSVVLPPYQPPTILQLHSLAILLTLQLCDYQTVNWFSGKQAFPQAGPKMASVARSTLVKVMAAQQTASFLALPPQQQLAALSSGSAAGIPGASNPALYLIRRSIADTATATKAAGGFSRAGISYLQSLLAVPDSAVQQYYQAQQQQQQTVTRQQTAASASASAASSGNFSYQHLFPVPAGNTGGFGGFGASGGSGGSVFGGAAGGGGGAFPVPPSSLAALPGPTVFPAVLFELQHGLFTFLRIQMERCNPLLTPGLWSTIVDIWIMVLTPWRARDRHKGEVSSLATPLLSARSFDYHAAALKAAKQLSAAAGGGPVEAERVAEAIRKSPDFALALAQTHDFERPKRLVHAGGEPGAAYSFESWRSYVSMNYAFYTFLLKVFLTQLSKAATAASFVPGGNTTAASAAAAAMGAGADGYPQAGMNGADSSSSNNLFAFSHPNRLLDCLERVLDVYEPCVVEELRNVAAVVESIFPSSSEGGAAPAPAASRSSAALAQQQQQQQQHQKSVQLLRETSGAKNDAIRVRLLCHLGALKLTPQAMQYPRKILLSIDDADVKASFSAVSTQLKAARDSCPLKTPFPSQELAALIKQPAGTSTEAFLAKLQQQQQHRKGLDLPFLAHHPDAASASGPLVRDIRTDSSASGGAGAVATSHYYASPYNEHGSQQLAPPLKWMPSVDRLQFLLDRIAIGFAAPVPGLVASSTVATAAAPSTGSTAATDASAASGSSSSSSSSASPSVVSGAKHAIGNLFTSAASALSSSGHLAAGSLAFDCSASATGVLWALQQQHGALALVLPTQLALLVSQLTPREQQQLQEQERLLALRKKRAAERGGLRGCFRSWTSGGEEWALFGARALLWSIHAATGYSLRPLPPPKDPFAPETDADLRLRGGMRGFPAAASLGAADDERNLGISAENRLLEALSPAKKPLSIGLLTRRGKIDLLEAGSRMTSLNIRFEEPDSLRPAGTHESALLLYATSRLNGRLLALLSRLTGIRFGRSAAEIKELMLMLSSDAASSARDDAHAGSGADPAALLASSLRPSRSAGPSSSPSFAPRTPGTPAAIRREMEIASARRTPARGPAGGGLLFADPAQLLSSEQDRDMASTRMGKSVLRDTYIRVLQQPPNYLRAFADKRVATFVLVVFLIANAWFNGLATPSFFLFAGVTALTLALGIW